MKRRVGTQRDKPRKELEERLARMELLLELSNSGKVSNSERTAIDSVNREKQSQLSTNTTEMHDPESQSVFPCDDGGMMTGIDQIEINPPKDQLSPNSQETAPSVSHSLAPLPVSLTQPQNQGQNFSPQEGQGPSQHVECADLLGSEVCKIPEALDYCRRFRMKVNLFHRLDGSIMVPKMKPCDTFVN